MNNPRVSIIAAIDENNGLGKNNDLLFKISSDMKRFREKTENHPIIMGRKTFESLRRPNGLPNRTNIIITRDGNYKAEGVVIVNSLEEGIEVARNVILSKAKDLDQKEDSSATLQNDNEEVFIIGGGQIFKEALEKGLVDRLYLTIVKGDYSADTFFPEYKSIFTKEIHREEHEEDGYKFTFLDLEK